MKTTNNKREDRQSTNFFFFNEKGEIAFELITDRSGDRETALALFEIAQSHKSQIPDSLKGFRK